MRDVREKSLALINLPVCASGHDMVADGRRGHPIANKNLSFYPPQKRLNSASCRQVPRTGGFGLAASQHARQPAIRLQLICPTAGHLIRPAENAA